MKIKLKICSNPKHLAWVSWTLLANNPVNKALYLLFSLLDLIILLFYSFNLVQRIHFANFDFKTIYASSGFDNSTNAQQYLSTSAAYELDPDYNRAGIKLTFLRSFDYSLNNLIRDTNS